MRLMKIGVILLALVGLAGIGLWLSPTIRGEQASAQERAELIPDLTLLPGVGSGIGVSVSDVDEAERERGKLPSTEGARIDDVRQGSPAASAGLRKGDVIVQFDGERVRSARQLARLVRETPPGRKVRALVYRNGQRMEIDVVPDSRSEFPFAEALTREHLEQMGRGIRDRMAWPKIDLPDFDIQFRQRSGRFGVSVQELGSQLADYFGVKGGVLVTGVGDDSPAAKAGLKAGDVIVSIDGATIEDTADLRRRLSRAEDGKEFSLGIVRDRKEIALKARLEPLPDRRRFRQPV